MWTFKQKSGHIDCAGVCALLHPFCIPNAPLPQCWCFKPATLVHYDNLSNYFQVCFLHVYTSRCPNFWNQEYPRFLLREKSGQILSPKPEWSGLFSCVCGAPPLLIFEGGTPLIHSDNSLIWDLNDQGIRLGGFQFPYYSTTFFGGDLSPERCLFWAAPTQGFWGCRHGGVLMVWSRF